jgi:hypothetical protein
MAMETHRRNRDCAQTVLKPYAFVDRVPVLSDGKTEAMEEQIEVRETRVIEFNKHKYLTQHIILSTTSTRLGAKIKNLKKE